MTLNNNLMEQLSDWCLRSDNITDIRAAARRDFFGYDEPAEARYMEGAGDLTSRERRFLGWFALTFKLPDGRCPAELAAAAILSGSDLTSAIDSVKASRFVLAMVAMAIPGRGLILRIENEEFTVDNRQLSRLFNRDDALCAHIIPVVHAGRQEWLVGPGWTDWPTRIMPGMQAMLKELQPNPISFERLLQLRTDPSKAYARAELPQDSSLKAAVSRMTKEAKAGGRSDLIMTATQWKKLVLLHMKSTQITDFSKEIVHRVGDVDSVDDLNKWLGLAMNIWNNTPQPDRGGKSAVEIREEDDKRSGG